MGVRPLSLAIGVLLLPVIAAAQAIAVPQGTPVPGPPPARPQIPARDNSAIPTGTARIRGRVVSADTGAPLRRATVRVSAGEIRVNRSVNTDAEGKYELADLPAGRYNIFVTRNGFVSLQFGQRRPFESGRPLDVGEAQTVEKIDFALPRGGVIAGRITDELGEPLAGVRMQAMRHQYLPNGQRQLAPVMTVMFGGTVSNDLGEFRLFGLMPGAYIVSATPSEVGGTMTMPGAAPSPSDSDGHGITYYPGTINADQAQPITVALSEEAAVSFALVPSRMTRVSGIVRDSQGQPLPGVMLTIRSKIGYGTSMRGLPAVGSDGRFTISNIPPGEHWLEVMQRSDGGEAASVSITAGDRDITDLVITTAPAATIRGSVTFESGGAKSDRPSRVAIYSPDVGGPQLVRPYDPTQGTIDANGQFQINGVAGRVLFQAAGTGFGPPPLGWSIKSVTFNGADITDIPLDIAATGSVGGVEVVMTDKQTTLLGTVRNPSGAEVTDYTVVIFPDKLRDGAVSSRYTRVVRPDQQGRFQTRGLPPGDYFAAAVQSLEQGAHWDPALRKQIEPAAKRFRLTEGLTSTIELQLLP